MRILIDATSVADATFGTSQYAWRLVEALISLDRNNHYRVLIRRGLSDDHPLRRIARRSNVRLHPVLIRPGGPLQQFKLLQAGARPAADVFHCLNFNLPLLGNPYRSICTIHDLKHLVHPDLLRRLNRLKRFYFGFVARAAVRRCAHVIAVSNSTRRDAIRHLGAHPARITTTHEASGLRNSLAPCDNSNEILRRLNIRPPYFLILGSQRPHKNIERAIQSFRGFLLSDPRNRNWRLVITGGDYAGYSPLGDLTATERYQIIRTGYVSDHDLDCLYRGAAALFFPSLYEGFGLPILEAMERGVPVVTSRVTSMPEVAGDAAILVDPYCEADMTRALGRVAQPQVREELVRRGLARARCFSWRRTAAQTLAVYRRVAARGLVQK